MDSCSTLVTHDILYFHQQRHIFGGNSKAAWKQGSPSTCGSQLVGHQLIYPTLEVRVLSPLYACRWDDHFQGQRSWDVGFSALLEPFSASRKSWPSPRSRKSILNVMILRAESWNKWRIKILIHVGVVLLKDVQTDMISLRESLCSVLFIFVFIILYTVFYQFILAYLDEMLKLKKLHGPTSRLLLRGNELNDGSGAPRYLLQWRCHHYDMLPRMCL